MEILLIIAGSSILLILGTIHLVYTFRGRAFFPRNPETRQQMESDHPLLTRETTIWKAWTGFNASHSTGAMFMGLINMLLAIEAPELFRTSAALWILDMAMMGFYVFLARRYWFRTPFRGILVVTLCFLAALVIILIR